MLKSLFCTDMNKGVPWDFGLSFVLLWTQKVGNHWSRWPNTVGKNEDQALNVQEPFYQGRSEKWQHSVHGRRRENTIAGGATYPKSREAVYIQTLRQTDGEGDTEAVHTFPACNVTTESKQNSIISSQQDGQHHQDDSSKYAELAADCKKAGWTASIHPVEVRCRGFVGRSAIQLFHTAGTTGANLQRSIKELEVEAEKAHYWLWLRRTDSFWAPKPQWGQLQGLAGRRPHAATASNWEMYWTGGETSVNGGSSWRPCSWPNVHWWRHQRTQQVPPSTTTLNRKRQWSTTRMWVSLKMKYQCWVRVLAFPHLPILNHLD